MGLTTNAEKIKELRKFSYAMAIALSLMFGIVLPWLFNASLPKWPWIAAAVFLTFGFLKPTWLAPVFKVWMGFANILGRINSTIILTIIYFVMFLPVAIIWRLIGKDPLHLKLDPKLGSYRVSRPVNSKEFKVGMSRPF